MLKNRFMLMLILFSLLAAFIVGMVSIVVASVITNRSVETTIRTELARGSRITDLRLQELSHTAIFLAETLSGNFFSPSAELILEQTNKANNEYARGVTQFLKDQVSEVSWVAGIVIVEADGTVLSSSFPSLAGRHVDIKNYELTSFGAGTYISPLLHPEVLTGFPWDTSKIAFAADIPNTAGMKVVVYGDNSLMLASSVPGTEGSAELYFFDKNLQTTFPKEGSVFSRYLNTQQGEGFERRLEAHINEGQSTGRLDVQAFSDGPYRVFIKHLHESSSTAVIMLNQDMYRQKVISKSWPILMVFIIIAGACVWGAYRISRRMFAPLDQVVMPAILSTASGDMQAEIPYESDNEVGVLARVYNELRTELAHKNRQLKEDEMRFALIMEQKEDIIFEWDVETNTIIFAPTFRNKFGFTPEKYHADKVDIFPNHINPDDSEIAQGFFRKVFSQAESAAAIFRIKRIDGAYLWVDARASALYDENETYYGAVGVLSDIHDIKTEELRLSERIRIDALSGTYSRQAFEEYARELIEKCQVSCGIDLRSTQETIDPLEGESTAPPTKDCSYADGENEESVALVFLDLDRFKDFNSRKGHAYGDRVIRYFGEVLNAVVGKYGIAGRVGGDEFALALDLKPGDPSPQELVNTIHKRLAKGMKSRRGESPTVVSVSVGFAQCPHDGGSYEELMQHADLQMLAEKQRIREEESVDMLRMLEEEGLQEAT